MPSRSLIIQLQAGVQQAILPDHRKMLPGIQYVVDWDTFSKLSAGARQNIIQVVTVNSDTTTGAASYVAAETATSPNAALNILTLLTTTSATPNVTNLAGFSAQGWSASAAGPTGVAASNSINFALTGPSKERYYYIQATSGIATGAVCVWADETNRLATSNRPNYVVYQDGQGTDYVATSNVNGTIGTKQGRYAGVALATIASGYYGWIQTEGFCPVVNVASGVTTAGTTLSVGGIGVATNQAAGYKVVASNNTVSGTALSNNVFATALTTASGTTPAVGAQLRATKSKTPYNRFLNNN